MGFKGPKGCTFLIVIVFASLLSTSCAGGQRRFFSKYAVHVRSLTKQETPKRKGFVLHSRVLKVNTNDYGGYNPSPTMNKPPFKLIPN